MIEDQTLALQIFSVSSVFFLFFSQTHHVDRFYKMGEKEKKKEVNFCFELNPQNLHILSHEKEHHKDSKSIITDSSKAEV